MGTIFVVATPIGNLEDLTFRALRTLKEVSFVLCEDTRVTKKLLNHYGVTTPVLSYHQHSSPQTQEHIFDLLSQGKNLALVTDAGTPGISDPGNELISFLSTKTSQLESFSTIQIVSIPGASALTAIASIAGIPMDKFLFLGYPPHKKGRKKFFEEVVQSPHPVIFYESPYRIMKTLDELRIKDYRFQVIVGRELTKKFETIYRGPIDQVIEMVQKDKVKGEFVVIAYQS